MFVSAGSISTRGHVAVVQRPLERVEVVERHDPGRQRRVDLRTDRARAADDAAAVVGEDRQRLVDRAVVAPVHHRDLRSAGEVAGEAQDEPVGVGGRHRQLPLREPEPAGEFGADPGGVGRRQHRRQPDRCLVGDRVGDSPDTVARHRTGVAEAEVDVLDAVDVDES